MDLSKSEIEEEIVAVKEAINAHKQQKILQEKGIKANEYLLKLMEENLKTKRKV